MSDLGSAAVQGGIIAGGISLVAGLTKVIQSLIAKREPVTNKNACNYSHEAIQDHASKLAEIRHRYDLLDQASKNQTERLIESFDRVAHVIERLEKTIDRATSGGADNERVSGIH